MAGSRKRASLCTWSDGYRPVQDDPRPGPAVIWLSFRSMIPALLAQWRAGMETPASFTNLRKIQERLELLPGRGLIRLVSLAKWVNMPRISNIRQGCDGLDFRDAEFIDLEADAAHARIDGDMDAQCLAQAPGFLGEEFGVLQVEDSRFDVIRQEFFCPPGVGMAEDEDFLIEMGIAPQFNGFV